ncbi:MAG TPA: hypothetical protein VFL80_12335 [Thermoanaerobaculia bacterium]|nr:hypothetical protein [Thermoanaerobaculia bacterium]
MHRKTAIVASMLLLAAAVALAGNDAGTLKKVEPSKVCMINEQFMDKEQIPVEVEGKTYFGCCEMCKKALAGDPNTRHAVDPVSGKTVDKAVAVIGADAKGKVFYFENEKNLKKYNARKKA